MNRSRPIAFTFCLASCLLARAFADDLSSARRALFAASDLETARIDAAAVLKQDPANPEALFIEMEAAALQADTAAELDAALRLCETRARDSRVTVAAARILDLAANSSEFRATLPRIQALIATRPLETSYLRAALLAAAADGLPGISMLQVARDSGLLTDWRIAGPFGRFSNVDFDRRWPIEQDGVAHSAYGGRVVERFRFADGNVVLPDYFDHDGVFYAASEIEVANAGSWLLRVESPGTLQIFVDGASVLLKDDRFRPAPEVAARILPLNAGVHRVLVKFVPAGAPFRIALFPAGESQNTAPAEIPFEPESDYVASAAKYWAGDYHGAIAQLELLRSRQPSAVVEYLLAQAWSRATQDSPEQVGLLHSVEKLAPTAFAAEHDLAARAYSDDRIDEALARIRRVVTARPDFIGGQELMSQIAIRLNWRAEASEALEARLRLHPSCSALRDAAKFFAASAQYDAAEQAEARLRACAPGSLAYAESLSDKGRHAEAARAATSVIAEDALDRPARVLLAHELALAGEAKAAHTAAQELVALAPNAEQYRRLAAAEGVDDEDPRASEFSAAAFYQPYRRDALQVLKDTAAKTFSGGPAVSLLNEKVARLSPHGSLALYVHKLTRVLDRTGIERYGEVTLPGNADLLELRTIKPDGSIAEPELTQHKSTISMPALAPGDVIEQEYVQHFPGGVDEHPEAIDFTFGSFAAPIVYSRFVAIWPAAESDRMQILSSGSVPQPEVRRIQEMVVRVWERNDIAQSSEEMSMPRRYALPAVRLLPAYESWADVRDYYRERIIEFVRIGPRAAQWAASVRGSDDAAKARAIFRLITSRVQPSGAVLGSGEAVPAEDTLAGGAGSRTAALLAVARAAGLHADLLLGRDVGDPQPQLAQLAAYARPLVRFQLVDGEIVVDAETEGMAFGGLLPTIARRNALLVPIETQPALARNAIVALPDTFSNEQSVAQGDLTLDSAGGLEGRITIRMGASRAAQMRSILAGIAPGERQHFFEQLALRIFPGAAAATGKIHNETDIERPLEIALTCRAPRVVGLAAGLADLDQLVPALGLRKMYGNGWRRFPLYIDVPLFETATFRVHLPPAISVGRLPSALTLQTEFGDYSVGFRQIGANEVEIQRAFRIPVQVVAPERFAAFSQFELQIDDAERQRITLVRESPAAP